jgi:hypothetical protein
MRRRGLEHRAALYHPLSLSISSASTYLSRHLAAKPKTQLCRSTGHLRADVVERAARAQPLELVARQRVVDGHIEWRTAGARRDAERERRGGVAVQQRGEPARLERVARADARIVGLVREPEREDALLLCGGQRSASERK